jgi:hypothetical protein
MKLIVRVCDYDWGKKDDNVGEIVIDARELALSDEPKTYNLTRNGKPEMGNITLIADFIPTLALTPTSDRSQSSNNPSKETLVLKVLRANGLRKCDWFSGNDVYIQVWRAPEKLPLSHTTRRKLPEPRQYVKLSKEPMTWRFAFPTRADTPGSAILKAGDRAFVAYYVKVEIDKHSWKNPSFKLPVVIIPARPAPTPALLSPYEIESEDQIKKMKCCCFSCGEAGNVTIKVQLGRRAYAPGEKVDLRESAILNNSSIAVRARVVLRQHITLSTTTQTKRTLNVMHRFHLRSKIVAPRSEVGLDELKIIIPAIPPSFFGSKGTSVAFREPLMYSYTLSVQGKAESGHKVKVEIPILISAAPPKASAIQEASSQNSSLRLFGDPFQIRKYAILDDKQCDTITPITGLEDGNGQIVPAMTGGGNIYEADDCGNGTGYCHYEPQVVVFSSSNDAVNTSETSTVLSPTNKEQENEAPTAPDEKNEESVEMAYNNLLESLEVEYDSRLVVDRWIKNYPNVAAILTPDEFAGILRKIVFSLEQASIARELTIGFHINNGRLTTDHINAALEACPYSKMDIVRVMAPYVVDSQNKESVLVCLYSYEREEASNLFP